jgi:phosphoribosylaminoimidazolecarboxamide formyltransferase/IMP cyclohydrolase
MHNKPIKSALLSVFYKDKLEDIVRLCIQQNITMYSTGGTQAFIEDLGGVVVRVEDITSYPSILDGRVKTLHPKVFGGILAIRNEDHLSQLEKYEIPTIDLVIVDLYPFEETVKSGASNESIIEKIDIGGISLIRAAAKNYNDVVIISSKDQYSYLADILMQGDGSTLEQRRHLAGEAFKVSSHYDTHIFNYFSGGKDISSFKQSIVKSEALRYGENPHQRGVFYGELEECFTKHCGKELSYNNLVDVDAGVQLVQEFKDSKPTFAILKHTNACGLATRESVFDAWQGALAADPVSAFGGILITNANIDIETAQEIDKIFYEVLIAPSFDVDALDLLRSKAKRIILQITKWPDQKWQFKSLLNGVIVQDADNHLVDIADYKVVTNLQPSLDQLNDLRYADICSKHLKSNTIVLVKNQQLIGMGCGQTSRVDACKNAIDKAKSFGFELNGAVMASDAFFPFPDCVELAAREGVSAVIQPGGSIKDQLSIDYCNETGLAMVMTGVRHFKH